MSLSTMRDLLIVIGIYLYFIAWVYLHAYYESFGISTESLRLDYSSYLIFSYNVITSQAFIVFAGWVTGILLAIRGGYEWLYRKGLQEMNRRNLRWKARMAAGRSLFLKARPALIGLGMILLFPVLFGMARDKALENYASDRTNTGERHRIEFIFRADAGFAQAVAIPDSVGKKAAAVNYDLNLLVTDSGRSLRYLGETDQYFIVLHQAQDPSSAHLPQGAIYYIDKKDVLLSHIILSSR